MKTTCASMATIDEEQIIIQSLDGFENGRVAMLRLDLLHPIISGNKWFKLKYNLAKAKEGSFSSVLSFGGAYSNHLIATAAAAKDAGLRSIGVVRGWHASENLTDTLRNCRALGMELQFVSREEYNQKADEDWLQSLSRRYPEALIIPEGGANEWGRAGAAEIAHLIPDIYTHVCCSVGSGTTLAGIRNVLPTQQMIIGFAPMKKGVYLKQEIQTWLPEAHKDNWQILDAFHFGGFGKWNNDLVDFMKEFYRDYRIPLDVVYTAKMMFGVRALMQNSILDSAARVLCVHSGGLQGNASVQQYLNY